MILQNEALIRHQLRSNYEAHFDTKISLYMVFLISSVMLSFKCCLDRDGVNKPLSLTSKHVIEKAKISAFVRCRRRWTSVTSAESFNLGVLNPTGEKIYILVGVSGFSVRCERIMSILDAEYMRVVSTFSSNSAPKQISEFPKMSS